ncbi:hypothetical protein AB0H37_37145 [Actinomadura sp. NPDC023710]|uniref:hypothetical protein n=1 Tax=Actinomadura sp. NPDC023710 TaxID=3158219 RepID=UPI0033EB6F24
MALSRKRSSDAGASAMEYAALALVGALVLGVLLTIASPGMFGADVEYAICRLFSKDPGQCESRQDKALKPDCTATLASESYGGSADVAIFSVGRDYGFMRFTTIGPDGRKEIKIVAVKGVSGGVGTGVGVGLNGGKLFNVGADASVDAKLKVGAGDGWMFSGPDAEKKADKFMGDIKEQYSIDAVKENGGLLGAIGGNVYDAFAGPDIPDPDIERYEGQLDVSGSLTAGLGVGLKDKPEYKGKHREETWKDKVPDSRGSNGVTPNINAYVGINGGEKVIYEDNRKTGDRSMTFILSGEANYGENHLLPGAQGRANASGSMTLTTDRNGKIKGVSFTQAHIVNGRATTITTTLPISTDDERSTLAEYLLNPLNTGGPGGRLLSLTWDDMAPTEPPGPGAHPLQRLLYDKGRTARVDYDYDQSDASYGASVKVGLKVGANVAVSNSDRQVTDARYLGAQGPGGTREWKDFKECR